MVANINSISKLSLGQLLTVKATDSVFYTFLTFFFCHEAQNFVHFSQDDLVQILSACGPNTYQIMYEETLDFQCQNFQWYYGKV